MKQNLFHELHDIPQSKYHPKFNMLKNEFTLRSEKEILLNWTENYIDKDKKCVKDFQTTFHSYFWEFFLHAVLCEAKFELENNKVRPDFIVKKPYAFNMEAVVANIKTSGISEENRTLEDILSIVQPPRLQKDFYSMLNEAIIRNMNALSYKTTKKYDEYLQAGCIQNDVPFLIALGSYDQINYGREFIYAMMALLYGWYYNQCRQLKKISKIFENT